jgi:hypothetical protein
VVREYERKVVKREKFCPSEDGLVDPNPYPWLPRVREYAKESD